MPALPSMVRLVISVTGEALGCLDGVVAGDEAGDLWGTVPIEASGSLLKQMIHITCFYKIDTLKNNCKIEFLD